MSRWLITLAAFLSLSISSAPLSVAQEYQERLDVRVIQVPVVVYRGGSAVTGLTQEDFELFVNGERQPIVHFDVVEFGGIATPRPLGPVALEQRRLTMLLFDLANSSPIQMLRARRPVEDLVNRASQDDYFAVATFDGRNVRYLAPFTSDRKAIVRAVTTLQRSRSDDPLSLTITAAERTAVGPERDAAAPSTPAGVEGGYSEDLITGMDDFDKTIVSIQEARGGRGSIPSTTPAAEADNRWLREQGGARWVNALADVADDLAPLRGIKQVALFSSGASSDSPQSWIIDEMHLSFRRAGVTLHVIDLAGLKAPGDASSRFATANHVTPDILFRSALGTGGRVIYNTGLENALRVFSETGRVAYVLSFRPPASERPEQNDIVVKLKNQPRLTDLSYRRGYVPEKADWRSVSDMFLADAMLNDLRLEDVTVAIYTDQRGTIEVGMPSNELLAHAVDGWVTVDVYIYLFDEAGNVVKWKQRRTRIHEPKARSILKGAELVRRERFSLEPGKYAVKVLVHVRERDLLSFQRSDFEVASAAQPVGRP